MPTKKVPAGSQAATPKAQSGKGAASGKAAPPSTGGKKPNALQKPLQPSKELAAVVGTEPLPRGEVVSKVWAYIKQHQLQNPENRREILADDKLEAVFGAKKVTMFEMNKHLARHLK
jgi:upstream activation factor subunit UAF30